MCSLSEAKGLGISLEKRERLTEMLNSNYSHLHIKENKRLGSAEVSGAEGLAPHSTLLPTPPYHHH